MQPWLAPDVRRRLVPVEGDALDGALHLAGERPIRNDGGVVMRTEQIDPRFTDLNSWSAAEMIAAMYEGRLAAAGAAGGG